MVTTGELIAVSLLIGLVCFIGGLYFGMRLYVYCQEHPYKDIEK